MRKKASRKRRQAGAISYSEELKTEAVQMLLDGHSAASFITPIAAASTRASSTAARWPARTMLQSMSRADNCYDNAFRESCFGSLKSELEMRPYANERIDSRPRATRR